MKERPADATLPTRKRKISIRIYTRVLMALFLQCLLRATEDKFHMRKSTDRINEIIGTLQHLEFS